LAVGDFRLAAGRDVTGEGFRVSISVNFVAFFSFLSPLEMPLTPEKLQQRTKRFAPNVFEFCDELPSKPSCWVVRKQLLRSASSVAANYRAACRAVSKKAFVAKLAIVEEEADESLFWLEMLEEMDVGNPSKGHSRAKPTNS
jgi:four helix bundle protein